MPPDTRQRICVSVFYNPSASYLPIDGVAGTAVRTILGPVVLGRAMVIPVIADISSGWVVSFDADCATVLDFFREANDGGNHAKRLANA